MPFRLDWKWNGEDVRLTTLRRFFEERGFNLYEEDVLIRVNEDGSWDFLNKPKPINEPEKTEEKKEEPEIPIDQTGYKGLDKEKSKKKIPLCKKCGARHWPMHKCK